MSLVWNWEYDPGPPPRPERLGDHTIHRGRPSLIRSDIMLKAIGKAASVRAAGATGLQVAMIILGNAPIPASYQWTVDGLRAVGLIQHFISVVPKPEPYDMIVDLLLAQEQTFIFSLSLDKIGLLPSQACQDATTPAERGRRFPVLLEAINDTEETPPLSDPGLWDTGETGA